MKKYLLILGLLLAVPSTSGAIQDEVASGVVKSEDITDREMHGMVNLNTIQTAFDKSKLNENVFQYAYKRNDTNKIRMRAFMTTTLVLPKGEGVKAITLGDSKNFHVVPLSKKSEQLSNMLEIYADYPGADTNMTIFGESGNIYSFYLRVDTHKSKFMPSLVVYITDEEEKFEILGAVKALQAADRAKRIANGEIPDDEKDYIRELPKIDPAKLSYDYETTGGDERLAPKRIFDDGYFTYFQFADDNLDKVKVPAIYRVEDGFDVPVNTRVNRGTIIAELVSDKWTFRSGEKHLCIRKEK